MHNALKIGATKYTRYMKIETIHSFEKAYVDALNLDGWRLVHTGETNLPFDAQGITPKGLKCVIEMKFRDKYYDTKILEVGKYNNLMKLDSDIQKFYFVNDPKGNYLFWLNDLKDLKKEELYCPKTTMWNTKKQNKSVYLLQEKRSIITNIYE
jgi:hypothetical protein